MKKYTVTLVWAGENILDIEAEDENEATFKVAENLEEAIRDYGLSSVLDIEVEELEK